MLPPVFIAWSSVKWIPTTPCIPFCMSTDRSEMSLPARLQEGQRQLSMSPQPGAQDGDISSDGETFPSHPSHRTFAGLHKPPACLGVSSLDPVSQATAVKQQR